jgi:hypothetical protein
MRLTSLGVAQHLLHAVVAVLGFTTASMDVRGGENDEREELEELGLPVELGYGMAHL